MTTPDVNDPDRIKAEIEATREQLGRTLDELSARVDVPARAKDIVELGQLGRGGQRLGGEAVDRSAGNLALRQRFV